MIIMKKSITIGLALALSATLFAGCLNSPPPAPFTPEPASGGTTAPVDVVTSASPKESGDGADLISGLSDSGFWIFSVLNDITLTEDLYINGDFFRSDNPASGVYRKLSLYAQDADRNVTAQYTLTVPNIFVTSTNMRIQEGTVRGNIFVDAMGFELYDATLEGDITFATRERMDSAKLGRGTINGSVFVGTADAVTGASPRESSSPVSMAHALSSDGFWIFSPLSDITLSEPLTISGAFYGRSGDTAGEPYRKLALYAQDSDRNVTDEWTITVPEITVESPGMLFNYGVISGNVIVDAPGFRLDGCTIEGNLTFTSQEFMDSADIENGTVSGSVSVG